MTRARSAAAAAPSAEIIEWIERLELIVHPEGWWYRETVRSDVVVSRDALPEGYPGDRAMMTSILFLLAAGMRSHWHRVRSEELWMHHRGDDLNLEISPSTPSLSLPDTSNDRSSIRLGQGKSAQFQSRVPPGHWQQAEAIQGNAGYALVGCVVVPGFEFEDFELAI